MGGSLGVRPDDSRFNHRFEPEPELNSNNTPKPAQIVFTLKIQSLYACRSSFSRPSPKKVPFYFSEMHFFALKSLFIVVVFVTGSIFQQPSWRSPERWRRTMPRCYFLLSLTNKYQQFLCPSLIHQAKK